MIHRWLVLTIGQIANKANNCKKKKPKRQFQVMIIICPNIFPCLPPSALPTLPPPPAPTGLPGPTALLTSNYV